MQGVEGRPLRWLNLVGLSGNVECKGGTLGQGRCRGGVMKFQRVVAVAVGLLVAATSAHAATYKILHSFNVESDGSDPRAVLVRGKDGVL